MDIESWLRGIGLERYAAPFRANDIGLDVLADLTDADLKELGVSLGDRKRLLKAIAALPGAPTSAAPVAGAAEHAAGTAEGPREAERRQLTVMFVDLVGSTELSRALDPEDMGELIRVYQNTVAGEITRFEGHVAKFMGDGVLGYFGWPKAHEDDAERAVRAGLAVTATVATLASPRMDPLTVRVGIATGLVMVGDLVGEGAAQEEVVVGETPNLAARLQALAEPGTVVVAEGTRRLLGGLFGFADLGARPLPGFTGLVPAYRVSGENLAGDRFEALHGHHLTPLVGREHEIGLLLDRWRQARDGDGQVVLLAGEPGIGKSRMLQSLRERLAAEPHTRLLYFCSPYHQNTAFHPILDQIERGADLKREDAPEAKLEKLEALFALSGRPTAEATAMTAALLGIPLGLRHPSTAVSPQGQKVRLQEIWLEQLAGLAARQPVLVLLEDAHWIDPSSLEQFDLVIDRIQRLPVLLVATFRPEFAHPWGHYPHVTALSLNRLSPRQSAAMVARMTGGKALPAEVLKQVVDRTDGVPLFVEELTKAVLESGLLRDAGDHYQLTGPLPPLAIPATLHNSLMARLDRLAPVREVAQVASVIGREFPHDLLAAAAGLEGRDLDEALGHLAAAELVFRRSMPPSAVYAFKHALVQEAAYASLLRGKRQQIHAHIAQVLQERFPDTPPEVLAHHLTEGGRTEASVDCWERAGRQAVSRAASKESVAHFRRALVQLQTLPETTDRKRREVALQSTLGGALVNVTGLASEELEQTYVKARDLCEQIGDARQQFVVEWGLWHVYVGRGEHGRARALAERLVAWAERDHDPEILLQACHAEWTTLNFVGEHAAARACCERGWALYDEGRHGDHAFTYGGHDPGVCSRNQGALVTWCLGYPDQARACYEEGLALARRLGHPQIVAHALTWGMPLSQLCRDRARLKAQAEAAFELAAAQDFANYRSDAQILRGWALSGEGEAREAVHLIRAGLAERQGRGTFFLHPYYLSLLARAQARAGEPGAALATVAEALDWARTSGEAWIEAELLRVKGELLLGGSANGAEGAERCFQKALESARAREARGWELRSAVSLARLRADQGRRDEARQLLDPVYAWFAEGFDTPDLTEAEALLRELA